MIRRQLVVAAGMFVLLAVIAFWVLRPGQHPNDRVFFSLHRALPDTLVVAYRDTTVLVAGDAGWRIIRPVRDLGNDVAVEAIIKRLRDFQVDRTLPYNAEQARGYGLAPPTCFLVAKYIDATPETLMIGYPNVASPKVYVRGGMQGDVGLVATYVPETYFLKNTDDLRFPYLLTTHETEITEFGFVIPGRPGTRMEKGPDARWIVRDPYPGPADQDYVNDVLKSFTHLEILNYRDGSRGTWEKLGLASPRARGWVKSSAGDSTWILIGAQFHPDSAYARVRGRAMPLIVPPQYFSFFDQNADAFRDTRLIAYGLAQLDSLRMNPGGASINASEWRQRAGHDLASVLRAFLSLRAEVILEATEARLARFGPGADELLLYGKGGLLVGMRIESRGVSQVAFWLNIGPGSRKGEIFLISRATAKPLLDYLRQSAG